MSRSVKSLKLQRFYVDGSLGIPDKDLDKFDSQTNEVVVIDEKSPPTKKLKKPTTSPYFKQDSSNQKLDLSLLNVLNNVTDPVKERITTRYTAWKSHISFIYDYFINHNVEENSCYSLEFGDIVNETTKSFTQQFFFLGYDPTIKQSHINMNEIVISKEKRGKLPKRFHEDDTSSAITHTKSIHIQGKVRHLRRSPVETEPLLATLAENSTSVHLWFPANKVSLQSSRGREPNGILSSKTIIRSFAWSSTDRKIVTATDNDVSVYNVSELSPKENIKLEAKTRFYGEGGRVSGISVGVVNDLLYCTSSHDGFVRIYDERSGRLPSSKIKAQTTPLTCIDWNKCNEYLIASGDLVGNWKIFDTRLISTDKPREIFTEKLDTKITSVQWSPNSQDKIGVSNAYKISIYKKQKLDFRHEGHRYTVEDWRWNSSSNECNEIASVAGDPEGGCTLQVWRPASLSLYNMTVSNLEAFLDADEESDEMDQ